MSTENYPLFFNLLEQYHMMILPVPYAPCEMLNEISMRLDDGKRYFMWLTPFEFQVEAMIGRVAGMKYLHQTLKHLNLSSTFCEEGAYDVHHQPSSSFSRVDVKS
jgi:hypothetical protein